MEQAGNFRRAKFEWVSKFIPAHWGLGLQKLGLVRFRRRAWVCRTNGTGPEYGIPHPSGIRPATFP